jgi:hypothetical protein
METGVSKAIELGEAESRSRGSRMYAMAGGRTRGKALLALLGIVTPCRPAAFWRGIEGGTAVFAIKPELRHRQSTTSVVSGESSKSPDYFREKKSKSERDRYCTTKAPDSHQRGW